MRIARAVIAAALLTALTACGEDDVTGSATPAVAAPSAANTSSPVFGPRGYGALRLGMTTMDAQATGEIAKLEDMGGDPEGCGSYTTTSGASGFTKHGKIVAIMHNKLPATTPEGITVGSTLDEVRAAYPTLTLGHNWSSADLAEDPTVHYGFLGLRLQSPPTAQVTQMLLYNDDDTCHN
ncbi:hypothetical protein ACWEKT_24490 [Nocardia takedensis]|uniref:hypothetical protein n=1 Tax=Nocardia takedensis TaxID=259390 RepID=UPI0002F2581A|nr:hypothetical protein [Nocardia takedensis]